MIAKIKSTFVIFYMLITTFSSSAYATSTPGYETMGKAIWSAFECSALAEKSKNAKEQDRLFKYGYAQGLKFISTIQQNKDKREELFSETPTIMLLLLQGPTPDFMLGRVFEGAIESALKDVFKTNEQFNSGDVREIIARDKFRKKNCQLIGK